MGATFALLQLPGRAYSEQRGEGRLHPSLAPPLSGSTVPGASGAHAAGAGAQAEAGLRGAGPAGVCGPRAMHPGLHPRALRRSRGELKESVRLEFLKLEKIGEVGFLPTRTEVS